MTKLNVIVYVYNLYHNITWWKGSNKFINKNMETMSLFPVDLIRVKTIIIKTGQGKIMIGMKKIKQKYKYNKNLVEL